MMKYHRATNKHQLHHTRCYGHKKELYGSETLGFGAIAAFGDRWELKGMSNAIVLDIGTQLYWLPDNSLKLMLL